MVQEKILVVEDDPHISNVVSLYLTTNDFDVFTAATGEEALAKTAQVQPDLVILDIQMPGIDGIEVCHQIRKNNNVPIIFLSCLSEGADIINGLTVGGDDYVTKPFDPSELLARVKAQLRRNTRMQEEKSSRSQPALSFPGLFIDPATHTVRLDTLDIKLSAREFQLLLLLARNPKVVLSADQMYQEVWQAESIGDNRTVMVHVSNLRKKLEEDPSNPKYIVTVKGVGYKFTCSPLPTDPERKI